MNFFEYFLYFLMFFYLKLVTWKNRSFDFVSLSLSCSLVSFFLLCIHIYVWVRFYLVYSHSLFDDDSILNFHNSHMQRMCILYLMMIIINFGVWHAWVMSHESRHDQERRMKGQKIALDFRLILTLKMKWFCFFFF